MDELSASSDEFFFKHAGSESMELCKFSNQPDDGSTKDANVTAGSDSRFSRHDAIKLPTEHEQHAKSRNYAVPRQHTKHGQHAEYRQHAKYEQYDAELKYDAEKHSFLSSTRSTEQFTFK